MMGGWMVVLMCDGVGRGAKMGHGEVMGLWAMYDLYLRWGGADMWRIMGM